MTWFRAVVVLGLVAGAAAGRGPGGLAPPRTPDGSKLLVAGPVPVSLQWEDAISGKTGTEPGTLLILTETRAYFWRDGEDAPSVYPAAADRMQFTRAATRIDEAPVGGLVAGRARAWTVPTKPAPARFTGPAADPVRARPAPDAMTAAQERAYLYFALQRLQARADDALVARDEPALAAFKARATEVAARLTRSGRAPDLQKRYADLPGYVDEQLKRLADVDAVIAANVRKNAMFGRLAQGANAACAFGTLAGFLTALTAATVPVSRTVEDDGSRLTVREVYDGGGILSGVGTMLEAQRRYQDEMADLAEKQKAMNADDKAAVEALRAQFNAARRKRAEVVRAAGNAACRAPADPGPREAVAAALDKPDIQVAADLVAAWRAADKALTGWENPFAAADFAQLRAVARLAGKPGREAGDDVFAHAVAAADAAAWVPPGAEYDFDRVDVLRVAASVAVMAAATETPAGVRSRAYSPRAMYAVRLLDAVPALDAVDVTGEAREYRSVCLMMSGRTDDAIREALGVAALRGKSALFHYNLARMYSARSDQRPGGQFKETQQDLKDSLESLRKAMAAGFHEVREVVEAADFVPLKRGRAGDFKALLAPHGTLATGPNGAVTLTNTSAYPLTDLKVRGTAAVRVGFNRVAATKFAGTEAVTVLKPGESVTIAANFPRGGQPTETAVSANQTLKDKGNRADRVWVVLKGK